MRLRERTLKHQFGEDAEIEIQNQPKVRFLLARFYYLNYGR
jgi:hypothetical protein